jgi:hypothetical protein
LYIPFHTPQSTLGKISGCFGRITFLGFFFFFLCSPSSPPLLLLPSSSFFFPPSSLSVTFLYFLSFVFLPKRRRRNGFWFKCRAPLPSSFFFFLSFFLPALSLSVYLFFTFFFFFCLFGSSAGLHVMLLDICLKFLLHLHFGVLCTLLFFLFLFLNFI